MKAVAVFRAAVRVAAAGAVLTVCAYGDAAPATVSKQELEAKVHYCTTCHGIEGRGFRGYYPIPRLAGQQPDYIKNQLLAFTQGRRKNPIMFSVAHVLSPAMLTALADYFNKLHPKPLGGGPAVLAAEGAKIFKGGVPSANIPACASCHGDDAKGNGEFPRLAGQLNDYVIDKLTNWSKERGQIASEPDTSAIMEPIAHGLTQPQIKALAAYVSGLE
jgi:cytochrome c553